MCVKGVLKDFKTKIVIELEKSLHLARTHFHANNMYSICVINLPRLAEVFYSYNSKVQFTVI